MSTAGHEGQRVVTPAALALFVALLGPPIVWLTALQIAYAFAAFACDLERSPLLLHATTVAALAVVAVTAVIAARHLRRSGIHRLVDADTSGHRARFLALGGVVLAAQFAAVLLAQELAVVVLAPCH
jgi:hypothetical protein